MPYWKEYRTLKDNKLISEDEVNELLHPKPTLDELGIKIVEVLKDKLPEDYSLTPSGFLSIVEKKTTKKGGRGVWVYVDKEKSEATQQFITKEKYAKSPTKYEVVK